MSLKLKDSAKQLMLIAKVNKDNPDRVIYARKAGEETGSSQVEGDKIDLDTAMKLKTLAWGSANMPPKTEWVKQGLTFHMPDQLFAYGLKMPENGVKNFLMCLQAYFLKQLLFEKKAKGGPQQSLRRVGGRASDRSKLSVSWAQLLKPNDRTQTEMMVSGLTEVLLKAADGDEAVFCLPGQDNSFEPTAHYAIDGITERLRLTKTKKEEDLKKVIKRYSGMLFQENGVGVVSILYSLLLSRNHERVLEDLQDQSSTSLIDPIGDCVTALLNLVITGKASPYLHNGIMEIEEEDGRGACTERVGIESRNDIGMLLWDKDELSTKSFNLGSRLKTPSLPIWVTRCNGHLGVLFNPNRELMRSYHAENRFQLYYFSDFDLKKEDYKETVLTIDTRNIASNGSVDPSDTEFDEVPTPLLEKAIQSKWDSCEVDWHGITPYV